MNDSSLFKITSFVYINFGFTEESSAKNKWKHIRLGAYIFVSLFRGTEPIISGCVVKHQPGSSEIFTLVC